MFFLLGAGLLIAGAAAKPELTSKDNGNKTLISRKWLIFIKKYNEKVLLLLVTVYYMNDYRSYEERVCLFDSQNYSVENIAKFNQSYLTYQVATIQNKVNFYVRYFE